MPLFYISLNDMMFLEINNRSREMEIFLWWFGIAIVIFGLAEIFEEEKPWYLSINWLWFFSILISGSLLLTLIFSFTAEGVFVIIGFFLVLILVSLFGGYFKKLQEMEKRKKKRKKNKKKGLYK